MREILFRGKRKDWKELPKEELWVEGTPIYLDDRSFIVTDLGINCIEDTETDKFIQLHAFEVIPETVGQYTGFQGKGRDKIFEGDIIICKKFIGKFVELHYEFGYVEIKHGAFGIHREQGDNRLLKDILEDYEEGKVIGNVFDNPELLEVQE